MICNHKAILYNSEWYLRVIPGKKLFNSTLIHEVVNRGDVFAIRIRDGLLTILPGSYVPILVDAEVFIDDRAVLPLQEDLPFSS